MDCKNSVDITREYIILNEFTHVTHLPITICTYVATDGSCSYSDIVYVESVAIICKGMST